MSEGIQDDRSPAVSPEELERLYVKRVNAVDVEGLMSPFDAVEGTSRGEVIVPRSADESR